MEWTTYERALLNVRNLVAKHVNLFSRNTFEIDILPGWIDTIDQLFGNLQKISTEFGDGKIQISKISPKFGGLRIDYTTFNLPEHVRHYVETIISMAESRSMMFCAYCGCFGIRKSKDGVASVKCEKHTECEDIQTTKSVSSFAKHQDELNRILRQEN